MRPLRGRGFLPIIMHKPKKKKKKKNTIFTQATMSLSITLVSDLWPRPSYLFSLSNWLFVQDWHLSGLYQYLELINIKFLSYKFRKWAADIFYRGGLRRTYKYLAYIKWAVFNIQTLSKKGHTLFIPKLLTFSWWPADQKQVLSRCWADAYQCL